MEMEFQQALDETVKELGFHNLKPKQREAVETLAAGKDVMVVFPTGYGKSIVYAVLPNLFDKMRGKVCFHVFTD